MGGQRERRRGYEKRLVMLMRWEFFLDADERWVINRVHLYSDLLILKLRASVRSMLYDTSYSVNSVRTNERA